MTTTVMTATAAPAVYTRMQPTPTDRADCADRLSDVRLSRYWPQLAEQLTRAVNHIHDAHATECRRRDCRTCTAIRAARAWITAHDELNTTGCGCAFDNHSHTLIPHPTQGFQS